MRTIKILFCFLLCIMHVSIFAQSWQWVVKDSCNASQGNVGHSIAVNKSGNIYVTGSFQASTYFNSCGTLNSNGFRNFFLAKYNNSGNCFWVKQAGDNSGSTSGEGLVIDKQNNIIVTGQFSDSLLLGVIKLTGGGCFMAKFDSNGNTIWAKSCPGTLSGITVDSKNNIYTIIRSGGNFGGGCTLNNGNQLMKLNPEGNCIWTTNNIHGSHINMGLYQTDSLGNSYIAGIYEDTAFLGSYTLLPSSHTYAEMCMAKYDSNGNCLWAKSTWDTGGGYPLSLGVDKRGNIYYTGVTYGNIYTGCDTLHFSSASNYYSFIAKFDHNGNCMWTQPNLATLSVTPNGKYFLAGGFSDTITIGSFHISGGPGIFLAELDSAGICQWVQTAGGNIGTSTVACDNNGNCYLTGDIQGNTIFGSIAVSSITNTAIFIAKLNVPEGVGGAHAPIHTSNTFNVYPNPSAGGYNLQISPNLLNSQLNICDMGGRIVFATKIIQSNPEINIPSLAKGVYYVKLITPQGQVLEKSIVQE